jgi:HEAT repeat protein
LFAWTAVEADVALPNLRCTRPGRRVSFTTVEAPEAARQVSGAFGRETDGGSWIMLTPERLIYAALALCCTSGPALAYIDAPPTLGRLVQYDATYIVVMQVEKVSKEKQAIIYKKVADLKGKYPTDRIKQHVSRRLADAPGPQDNPRPRGGTSILDWAEPGKLAIFFQDGNRKASATCVGKAWYFGWEGKDGWWGLNEFEERAWAWAYIGSVEKLRDHVTAIMAGKEVVVTAARHDKAGGGNRELWDNQTSYRNLTRDRKIRVWRIRASRKITSHLDVRDKPDYVVGLGTGDRAAVPGLVKDLKSKDPSVRGQAAEELCQVGPEAKDAIAALTEALKDPDGRVRVNAAEAVWRVGRKPEAAVTVLVAALGDKEVQCRRLAAETLWRMGPAARGAVGALAEALKDKDGDVRWDAAETLWRIGPEARAAITGLTGALKHEDRNVRRSAAGALGSLGPEAKVAVPALTKALQDKDLQTRHFAARALVRLGDREAKQAAAPILRDALQRTPDQRVRAEIIVFLWTIGPEPESTFPGLKTGDTGDMWTTTQLLRKVDKDIQKNAVPTLIAAFKGTRDANGRADFVRALGEIGPAAKASVPALTEALKDKAENVRNAATEALKKIQQK